MFSNRSSYGAFAGIVVALGLVVPLQTGGNASNFWDGSTTTSFRSLTPCRLIDSRIDDVVRVDATTIRVPVAGRCDISTGAAAAALTVTATKAAAPGYATVYPSGADRPATSNLNFEQGSTVANSAIIGLSNGSVDIHHSAEADVILDVTGEFIPVESATAGRYSPIRPERIADTRISGQRSDGDLKVSVTPLVPDDAIAVATTITIIDAAAPGHFTVHRTGEPLPLASFANTDRAGQTRAATVIAPLSPTGFTIHRSVVSDIAVDVLGYFTGESAEHSTTGLFVPTNPRRTLDTREYGRPLGSRAVIGHPATDGSAVIGNLTNISLSDAGFATVYPNGTHRPDTSTLNSPERSAMSNMTISAMTDEGLAIYTSTEAHVILDVTGHFTGTPVSRDPGVAPASATDYRSTAATPQVPPNPQIQLVGNSRDAWTRPFTPTSIWNMPIGSNARYRPASLPHTKHHALEHVYLMRTSTSDPARPLFRNGSWRDRCSGTEDSGRTIHLPDGWMPRPVEGTATPNNPGAFLQPDGRTVVEVNAMGRCSGTGPLFGQWGAPHHHVIDMYGDGISGNRGASKLSQFGGPIRYGEMTGPEPIRHALDLLIWAEHLYWGGTRESSYRWPATSSDAYAGPERYRGSNPELRMGSLLALPPSATPESVGINTAEGRKLFHALQDYGAYITDDSAWNATYLAVESTAVGTFEWGDAQRADMSRMVQNLHVVTNNSPTSIGGGGSPRQPLLPELVPPD